MRFSTKAIRVGQQPDPTTGSIIVPVYQTVNFVFDEVGKPHGYEYSRSGNPTRTALEQCLASLEEAPFRPGVQLGHGRGGRGAFAPAAGRSRGLGGAHLRRDVPAVREGLSARAASASPTWTARGRRRSPRRCSPTTKLVWIETPANPLLQLVDVRAVAEIAHDRGAKLVADNTFASPYFQRPLTQGADIVLHSTTKYISGHSDVIGGAVVTNDPAPARGDPVLPERRRARCPGPWDCWLSLRGLKTLAVRMRQHEANAQAIAEFLAQHPKVRETIYPGLPSHPQHELAKAQMDGFGAIVTFRLDGGVEQVRRFVKALKLFLFAESLGGVESLVCHPATMSHATLTPAGAAEDRHHRRHDPPVGRHRGCRGPDRGPGTGTGGVLTLIIACADAHSRASSTA